MSGYIKLHRKLLKWGWYGDVNTKAVFLHLLLTASYEDNFFRGHEIKAGQAIIGRKRLSEELGISERAVRTALNHLKSTNEITIKTTNKFSIVTIENWEKYQCLIDESDHQNDQQHDQQVTNNRPASDHTQEIKEINNNITSKFLDEEFETLWKMYPKREGKKKAKAAYIRARKSGTTYEDVEAGIIAYKQHIAAQGIERQFIKMGSTYFNGKCWEDVYEEHSSSSGWSISDEEFAALAAAHEGVDEW